MTELPNPRLASILALVKAGDFAGALAAAEQQIIECPGDVALVGIAALSAARAGQRERAVALLQRQLELTPQDRAARFNLASALTGLGRNAEALALAADYADQPQLARLAGYLHQEEGAHAAAIAAYDAALASFPDDWESWNNLGNSLAATGEQKLAIAAFENAINRAPGDGRPELFLNLARALSGAEDREKRLNTVNEGARRFPDHGDILLELGLAQAANGQTDAAEQTLIRAAAGESGFGEAHLELGLLYETTNRLGQLDAHIAACEALDYVPELAFLKAWSLRRHNKYAEAAELAAQIPDTISSVRSAQLRAEIADKLGNYAEAFDHYCLMNADALESKPAPAGPTFRELIEAQTAAMQPLPDVPPVRPAAIAPADPIFIVGSPRSGTTLLDTLLGALPELQVFEELPMLAQVEAAFPDLATSADAGVIAAARQHYFELAAQFEGAAEGRRIVDKMPLHLTHMPVIHRLFPEAAIVLVERHPCDAVLSCFMANFTLNHAMRSYADLVEAALTYDAVFANWIRAEELFPLRVHRVRYERMIADLENEMRALLGFLDLPWREEVLDNQTSAAQRGAVRTASYSQIGQPLYSHAVGRWPRYRPMIDPILPIVQPWIAAMGY